MKVNGKESWERPTWHAKRFLKDSKFIIKIAEESADIAIAYKNSGEPLSSLQEAIFTADAGHCRARAELDWVKSLVCLLIWKEQ